jgi:hypothetical protein
MRAAYHGCSKVRRCLMVGIVSLDVALALTMLR